MKCEKCGKQLEENSKFCSNCGEPVKNETKETIIEAQKVNNEEIKQESKQKIENTIVKVENSENQNNVKQAQIVKEEKQGLSIASLILGIVAILCVFEHGILNLMAGILAIIFGAIGRKQGAKGMGTTGMILGIASLVILVIVVIFIMIFASALIFGLALS